MGLKIQDIRMDTHSWSAVVLLIHMPTGIHVECNDSASRYKNEQKARAELERQVNAHYATLPSYVVTQRMIIGDVTYEPLYLTPDDRWSAQLDDALVFVEKSLANSRVRLMPAWLQYRYDVMTVE